MPVVNDKVTSHTDFTLKGTVRSVDDLSVIDVTGGTINLRYSINDATPWVELLSTIDDGPNGRVSRAIANTIITLTENGTFRYEWRGTDAAGKEVASLEIETLRVRAKPV